MSVEDVALAYPTPNRVNRFRAETDRGIVNASFGADYDRISKWDQPFTRVFHALPERTLVDSDAGAG